MNTGSYRDQFRRVLRNVDRQAQIERASQQDPRKGAVSLPTAGRLHRRARWDVYISPKNEALVLPLWISADFGGSGRFSFLRVLFLR